MKKTDKQELFPLFHQALLEEVMNYRSRSRNQLNKMKEYWGYFSRQFENYQEIHFKLTRTETLDEFVELSGKLMKTEPWRNRPIIDRPMSE